MAVGTHALTSLANLKAVVGIGDSGHDGLLENCIDRATAAIESHTDRKLKSRLHSEFQMPEGERVVKTDQFPIVSIDTVAYGRQDTFTVTSDTASTDVLATVGFDGSELRLRKTTSGGTSTTATVSATTYPTTSQMVSQINSSVSGWSATLVENALSSSLYQFGGRGVKDAPCHVRYPRDNVSEYEVDFAQGIVHITTDRFPGIRSDDARANAFPSGFFPVFVQYTAGYETVPDDLEQACLEIARDIFNDVKMDTNLASEALGDYNFSRISVADKVERYASLLTAYRKIR